MKSTLLLSLLILFTVNGTFAQSTDIENPTPQLEKPEIKRNFISFSPLHMVYGGMMFYYEREIGNRGSAFSLGGGPTYVVRTDETRTGGFLEAQFKIGLASMNYDFGNSQMRQTFYMAPVATGRYMHSNMEYTYWEWDGTEEGREVLYSRDEYASSIMGSLIFGTRLVIMNKVSLNLYFGGGLRISDSGGNWNIGNDLFSPGYTGVAPKLGMDFGINF